VPDIPLMPGLTPGGTYPTQVKPATGHESIAELKRMEETGDILLWLGDKGITAMKILVSYVPVSHLQKMILDFSVGRMDYSVEAPNLFSNGNSMYSCGNSNWLDDVMNGKPALFTKTLNQNQTTLQQSPSNPGIPTFVPSNKPIINRLQS
jgi:hypothetical protein